MKIVCFLGGILVGGILIYFVINKTLVSPIVQNSAITNAGAYHRILVHLREGKTNDAIDLLEMQLDGELITFFNYRPLSASAFKT